MDFDSLLGGAGGGAGGGGGGTGPGIGGTQQGSGGGGSGKEFGRSEAHSIINFGDEVPKGQTWIIVVALAVVALVILIPVFTKR